MITHCSKCDTNWARLKSCEVNEDDHIEVCPVCQTDSFLGDATDFDAFIQCQITGKIINVHTGKEKETPMKKPVIRIKVGKPEPVTKEEREDIALLAIDNYHKALDDGKGREAAEAIFFETHSK